MKKTKKLEKGDVFLIPLEGVPTFGVGQVLAVTKEALNSVLSIFYDLQVDSVESLELKNLSIDKVFSIQFTTTDLLGNGTWPIVGKGILYDANKFLDFDALESGGFLGVEIEGSAIIRKFLSAYLGLYPWNCYYRDDYFDGMLLNPDIKPERIFYEEK